MTEASNEFKRYQELEGQGLVSKSGFDNARAAFEIEGEDGLEVQVLVPETLIRRISKGTRLAISYPGSPGLTETGIITEIGSRAQTANKPWPLYWWW